MKHNPNIKGIQINDSKYLLSQYADDSTLTLADDLDSLNAYICCIDSFAQCFGLKPNFQQSQALWIRAKRDYGEEYHTTKEILCNHDGTFKLVGFQYDLTKKNPNNFTAGNYNEKVQSMKKNP